MYVERLGESGPTVVLVHGSVTPGWATWDAQRPLADRYRLVVPHRTGYPPNPPLERIDFEVQAGEIAELIEPGTHLVGHSYGGMVSLVEGIWHLSPIEARDSPATNDLPITMRLAESPEPFDSPSARVGLRIDQARALDDLTAHIGLPPRLRVVGDV